MAEINLAALTGIDWADVPDGAQKGDPEPGLEVMALMMWPDDQEERDGFVARCLAGTMQSLFGPSWAPPDVDPTFDPIQHAFNRWLAPRGGLIAIGRGKKEAAIETTLNRVAPGWVTTAIIMRVVLAMHRHHPEVTGGPSVNKAVEIFPIAAHGIAGLPSNVADIRAAWSANKSVAHLCAAYYSTVLDPSECKIGDRNIEPVIFPFTGLHILLGAAREYQEFGLAFKARGRSDPMLPVNLWSVPSSLRLPKITIDPGPLPVEALAAIRSYRAPIRV